jgi:hypothetical protein
MSSKGVPASECLQKNCPVPSNVLVKDFARWYCKSRSGRLAPKPNLRVEHILAEFGPELRRRAVSDGLIRVSGLIYYVITILVPELAVMLI